MTDLLVDTDVLVDHLRGLAKFRPGRDRVFYSVLTRVELLAGRPDEEERVRGILATLTQVGVSQDVAETAGTLRRDLHLGLADAVIAATSLSLGVPIITRNRRDLGRVPRLRVRAPR